MELQEEQNDLIVSNPVSLKLIYCPPEISQESAKGESISPIEVQNIKILCAFLLLLAYKCLV